MSARKRANGEGSIYQRSDGRWAASLMLAGQRRTVYGRTKTEVAHKLKELHGQAHAGRLIDPSRVMVSTFLRDWLDVNSSRLRPSTLESYRNLIQCHVLPQIGGIKVQGLKPLHLVRLYSERQKAGVSARRILMTHRVLHKAFGDAVKWRLLSTNPAADVDPPQWARPETAIWSPEEVAVFLGHAAKLDRYYDTLWIFLLGSGCRLGEALAIRWLDIDTASSSLRVLRSVTHVEHRPVEGDTKTSSGRRTIYLPSFAFSALNSQRGRQIAHRLKAGEAWSDSDRIFTTQTGAVPTRSSLLKMFRSSCRVAGVPEIRIHDLRHVHATLAIRSGADPKTLQRRLGHSSLQMTLGLYTHAVVEADRELAFSFQRLMFNTPGEP